MKISVIVPIYNAEKHLHRCVDSILAQTFTDFELLLVNDGSKDKSGAICDEYAAKDSHVRVFHKENGGVSSARNLGLDNAKGEWITFVDSDDWVSSEYLSNMYSCVSDEIDMVFSYATIYTGNDFYRENYPSCIVCSNELDSLFSKNDLHWHTSPWSKLYRTNLIRINKLKFDNGIHIGEDLVFVYSYMLLCSYIYVSSHADYNYNDCVENSLTQRIFDLQSEQKGLDEIKVVVNRIVQHGQITSVVSISNINWIVGYFTNRVLNALYHNELLPKKKRIEVMRNLDLSLFVNAYKCNNLKERILINLIKNKLYSLYDFIRYFYACLR